MLVHLKLCPTPLTQQYTRKPLEVLHPWRENCIVIFWMLVFAVLMVMLKDGGGDDFDDDDRHINGNKIDPDVASEDE